VLRIMLFRSRTCTPRAGVHGEDAVAAREVASDLTRI
jgi:hypothetical protein